MSSYSRVESDLRIIDNWLNYLSSLVWNWYNVCDDFSSDIRNINDRMLGQFLNLTTADDEILKYSQWTADAQYANFGSSLHSLLQYSGD